MSALHFQTTHGRRRWWVNVGTVVVVLLIWTTWVVSHDGLEDVTGMASLAGIVVAGCVLYLFVSRSEMGLYASTEGVRATNPADTYYAAEGMGPGEFLKTEYANPGIWLMLLDRSGRWRKVSTMLHVPAGSWLRWAYAVPNQVLVRDPSAADSRWRPLGLEWVDDGTALVLAALDRRIQETVSDIGEAPA